MADTLRTSRPALLQSIQLNTTLAQRLFMRYQHEVGKSLYYLSVSLRFATGQPPPGAQTESDLYTRTVREVDTLLQQLAATVNARQQQLDQLKLENGLDNSMVAHSNPLTVAAKAETPRELTLLSLFRQVDSLITSAELLWLCQLIDEDAYFSEVRRWRTEIVRPIVRFMQLGVQVRALSWFDTHADEGAEVLKILAERFQTQALHWGEDGFIYTPDHGAQNSTVALRFPAVVEKAAVEGIEDVDALLRSFASRGWVQDGRQGATLELGPSLRVIRLSPEVSGYFLLVAGVGRRQRQALLDEHRQRLAEQATVEARAEQTDAEPAFKLVAAH